MYSPVLGENVTSAGWQVTLCDPVWHVSSRSGDAGCELLYSLHRTFTLPLQNDTRKASRRAGPFATADTR